jgi:hypothetical protein
MLLILAGLLGNSTYYHLLTICIRIKSLIENYVGYEASEKDTLSIMRRLDIDADNEISFSDFFASMLPYFIFSKPSDKKSRSQSNQKFMDRSFVGGGGQ